MYRAYLCACALILGGCVDPIEPHEPAEIAAAHPSPVPQTNAPEIPKAARPYAKYYKNHGNPSRNMALAEQECSWNHNAISPVGAMGCAQVMPDTLEWGAETFAAHLGEPDPHNPEYAAHFTEAYMVYLDIEPFGAGAYCRNRWVDELRYNGGYYIIWELKYSDGSFAGAESICGTRMPNGRKRSQASCKQNYDYMKHIDRRQPKYRAMGGKLCNFRGH